MVPGLLLVREELRYHQVETWLVQDEDGWSLSLDWEDVGGCGMFDKGCQVTLDPEEWLP